MALAGLRLRILIEEALGRGLIAVVALKDREAVCARFVADDAGNAGSKVRAVRLEGARTQRLLPRLAFREEIVDCVGLVSVRHNRRIAEHTHSVVNDEARIFHLALVKRAGSQVVAHGLKYAIAAVSAAAHDKIRNDGLFAVLAAAEQNAAARIAGRGDFRLHVFDVHFLTPP